MTDLLGGQVQLTFDNMLTVLPQVKAGKLRGLAVTSARRSPMAPEIPTVAEAGVPGYDVTGWYGFVVPKGTPADVVRVLNREITAILRAPETVARLESTGASPTPTTPEAAQAFITNEMGRWGKLIRDANIKAE